MLLKLILENYVPLLSSGIFKVELDLHHMVNLFISSNGSGKSSILKEVNPMPPENCNYRNGRKYFEVKIGNKHYVLDSRTDVANGHSFVVNGEELNDNGTYTVQKNLVATHLDLDANLVRVLNGIRIVDRLSSMPISRRKDIIMQVYPNKTDYALGVFNKLKTERNELKAAIKNQVSRYAEENRKLDLINQTGIKQLEIQIQSIDAELKQALLLRGQLEGIKVDPELDRKIGEFTLLTDQLAVNKISGFVLTEPELQEALGHQMALLDVYQEQAAIIQHCIGENAAHLEGLEEFLKDPDSYREHAKHIDEDLFRTNTEIDKYNRILEFYPLFKDPDMVFDGLEHIADEFQEYLNRVIPASSQEMTGGNYKGYLLKQEQFGNQLRELNLSLTDMTHRLQHYEKADDVDCPECSHQFKVGISREEIEKLRHNRDGVCRQIERLEDQIAELNKRIENDADWYTSMNQLMGFVRSNSYVKVLPDLIKEFEVGKVASHGLCNALQAFMGRAELVRYKGTLNEEKTLLEARIALLDRNNLLDVAVYVTQLEKDLQEENEKIARCKERISYYDRSIKTIQRYSSNLRQLEVLQREILDGIDRKGKVDFCGVVDQHVHKLTGDKEEKLAAIIRNRSLNAVVESISEDIERLKHRLSIVEVWMEGLCPNKGFIGKLMTDFIKSICGNINSVIRSVWNTPLYIIPCNKENGDLTYKFPVMKGDDGQAPDISECSGGEADIIDWAFRLTLLNYVRFPFPLIMDEVGVFFDEIKRGRFFNFVQEYTQEKDARQLFLVSHYVATNSQFTKPNIVALKYEGLTLPGEPNTGSLIS